MGQTVVVQTGVNELLNAWEVNTLQYKLVYMAINSLQYDIDTNPQILTNLSEVFGVPEDTISTVLEELYTNNPDPDNAE